jgi:hypothetical protein
VGAIITSEAYRIQMLFLGRLGRQPASKQMNNARKGSNSHVQQLLVPQLQQEDFPFTLDFEAKKRAFKFCSIKSIRLDLHPVVQSTNTSAFSSATDRL